jgi:hypothetical protein
MLERAEPRGVRERGVEILGGVAGAQQEDAARLVPPDARRPRAQQPEEGGTARAQTFERDGELIEIEGALAARRRVEAGGVELVPGAARGELVAGDAGQIGRVDEQLALRDAHRQDVGHVVVRHGVAIARPIDEAVDAAHAIDDARRVVGVARQRQQLGLLFGEPLEAGAAVTTPRIDDSVEPGGHLGAHVVEVAKRAAVEERALVLPERPLDAGLGVGRAADRARPKLVMSREGEESRIVDRLIALPARHHGLLTVVRAAVRAAAEATERLRVPVHQRVQVIGRIDRVELTWAVRQYVRERLHLHALAGGEVDHVRRPVALGHLAGTVGRCLEARRRLPGRAQGPHVLLDRGVAAVESLLGEDLEHALRGDVRIADKELGDPVPERVRLLRPRRPCRRLGQRRVRGAALRGVSGEHRLDGVATDTQ